MNLLKNFRVGYANEDEKLFKLLIETVTVYLKGLAASEKRNAGFLKLVNTYSKFFNLYVEWYTLQSKITNFVE